MLGKHEALCCCVLHAAACPDSHDPHHHSNDAPVTITELKLGVLLYSARNSLILEDLADALGDLPPDLHGNHT